MAIRNNKLYRTGKLEGFPDEIENLLEGGKADPSGGSGGGGGSIPPPAGANLKIIFRNKSKFKDKLTFPFAGQTYYENSVVSINSNNLNDSETILPNIENNFKLKNYIVLTKSTTDKDVEVRDDSFNDRGAQNRNSYTETIKGSSIRVDVYDLNNTIVSTREYLLPATIELDFDLEQKQNEPIEPKVTKQNITVITNYVNTVLDTELSVKLLSADVPNGVILKTGESVEIQSVAETEYGLNIEVQGLSTFKLKNIRWQYAKKFDENSLFNVEEFNIVSSDTKVNIPKDIFNDNIILLIEVEPNDSTYPKLFISDNTVNVGVEETILQSTTETKSIVINSTISNLDLIKVITPYRSFTKEIKTGRAAEYLIELDLKTDFKNNLGAFKVILVPYSELFGDGQVQSIRVNISQINDIPIVDSIEYPTDVLIPTYSFGDVNFKISFESLLATSVLVYHSKEDDNTQLGSLKAKDSISINYNSIKKFKVGNSIDLLLIPYNKKVKGEPERISIKFDDSNFYVSTQNLKDELLLAISSQLKIELNNVTYLNHIASFETDDKQIVVSNWDVDNTTFTKFKTDELGNQIPDGEINKSVVIKLYEPLPVNINKNDTLWISEISALPILQSVILTGTPTDICVPLRAPNFDADVDFVKMQSTGMGSYDDLILSGSATSQQLVEKYLADNFIDIKGVNIDYSDFSNFVKYSSAVERLANFRYKKELVEFYDNRITVLNSLTASATKEIELETLRTKKSNLVTGFDGWENYLTQSVFTSSFVSTFIDGNIQTYNNDSTNLYETYYDLADSYDKNSVNLLKNNIPLHIVDDSENLDFLLFLDMIGNYFDIIWAYIKGITEQKNISEAASTGISDDILYDYLKSFGWNPKNLNSNKQLWDYTFGLNDDGELNSDSIDQYLDGNTESITPEQATKQVWRRIANNLPYLLKHKGSVRGITALLTCYGIPASNLSIMEFGGPNVDTVEDSPKFVYNSLTHNLVFDNVTASLNIPFTGTPKPQAIELRLKPENFENYTLVSGSGFRLGINADTSTATLDKYGYFTINGTQVSTSYPFYDGNYHSVLFQQSGSNTVKLYAATNYKDDIIHSGEWTGTIVSSNWEAATNFKITNFIGNIEEVRIWKTALSESVFNTHVIMPEAVNGNDTYASTTDLLLRLDFERPQNLTVNTTINNVAPSIEYVNSVSASGFVVDSTYPFNYETYERELSLTIPNSGASRYYTNKVRFESQELVANLSPTKRATKKAFETSATDSNRVGLFFSPNKDLDLDIAKSLGGQSFDDFLGDPLYEYGYTNYPQLDSLRNYYFERVGERNIYEFIRLVKFYDKSLFVNLREMIPARAVVTTGLLIAPHILERSKHKINKPIAESETLEGIVTDSQITELNATFDSYDSILNVYPTDEIGVDVLSIDGELDASEEYNFEADVSSYESIIGFNADEISNGEYLTYDGIIDAKLKDPTILSELDLLRAGQVVGIDNFENYGFGTYFSNGYGKYIYEENGAFKSKGIRAFIVTKKSNIISTGFDNKGYEFTYVTASYDKELIIQDLHQSASVLGGDIISAVTASGYLRTHYSVTGDKHLGLQNAFYRGSKQTSATTVDGKSPIETFVSNPTTLRISPQGRSNSEPILEVE
jgi:hypothetical protein